VKPAISIILAVALNVAMGWTVIGPFHTNTLFRLLIVVTLIVVANLGTFWMLYFAIRNEKHPLLYVVIAFIPYSFLWYLFSRVNTEKNGTASGRPNKRLQS
jgi:hypothetical protein